ncbi:MAG: autoinducer binding domain-containing protein [Burkholderiaceae bacterium]
MIGWQDKSVQKWVSAQSEDALFEHAAARAAQLGFEYCAYVARVPVPVTQPRHLFFSNTPRPWHERYRIEHLWESDPMFAQAQRTSLPVVWTDLLFEQAPEFAAAAREHGLVFGWSQLCIDALGARAVVSFMRSQGELTDAELTEKNESMAWTAQVLHAAMMMLDRAHFPVQQPAEPLSYREREVLRWTADGKTAAEVAEILVITERTVNFHINRCIEKLKVNNKLAATVRAAMLGLL